MDMGGKFRRLSRSRVSCCPDSSAQEPFKDIPVPRPWLDPTSVLLLFQVAMLPSSDPTGHVALSGREQQ